VSPNELAGALRTIVSPEIVPLTGTPGSALYEAANVVVGEISETSLSLASSLPPKNRGIPVVSTSMDRW
jgi:hypothetical protein